MTPFHSGKSTTTDPGTQHELPVARIANYRTCGIWTKTLQFALEIEVRVEAACHAVSREDDPRIDIATRSKVLTQRRTKKVHLSDGVLVAQGVDFRFLPVNNAHSVLSCSGPESQGTCIRSVAIVASCGRTATIALRGAPLLST